MKRHTGSGCPNSAATVVASRLARLTGHTFRPLQHKEEDTFNSVGARHKEESRGTSSAGHTGHSGPFKSGLDSSGAQNTSRKPVFWWSRQTRSTCTISSLQVVAACWDPCILHRPNHSILDRHKQYADARST
eukprot:scaffold103081_cov17-Tisochrysis_lutea.AAC.2